MRATRRGAAALTAVVAVMLVAAACGPLPPDATIPPPPPTDQPVPPGGEVIATSPWGTSLGVEAATSDLEHVVYGQSPVLQYDRHYLSGKYFFHDGTSGTTTELPFARELPYAGVDVAEDGTRIVFASPDPDLQVGPVEQNCRRDNGLFQPLTPIHCSELYLYETGSGEIRQLTGLDGSSSLHNIAPELASDGATVEFVEGSLLGEAGRSAARIDLDTGVVEELPWEYCCSWDRGDTIVRAGSGFVTSTDVATGVSRTLPAPSPALYLSAADNGRWIVVHDGRGGNHLVDTELETYRQIPGSWVDDAAANQLVVQQNVAPTGGARLIVAPLS